MLITAYAGAVSKAPVNATSFRLRPNLSVVQLYTAWASLADAPARLAMIQEWRENVV